MNHRSFLLPAACLLAGIFAAAALTQTLAQKAAKGNTETQYWTPYPGVSTRKKAQVAAPSR